MITLLMAFFALFYTLSQTDQKGFEHVATSVQNALGGATHSCGPVVMSSAGLLGGKGPKPKTLDKLTGLEDEALLQDLRQKLKGQGGEESVNVIMHGNQVILQVGGQVLFAPNAATLAPQAQTFLEHVVRTARNYPDYRIDTKGHTDPRHISNARFESNWKFSALRATSVLRYLMERGIAPNRLTATGYTDTHTLAPNNSEENMAKNRMVEFVLGKKEK